MNLLLFESEEIGNPLRRGDERYEHIRTILKSVPGDVLEAGIVNGPRGRVMIRETGIDAIKYDFVPGEAEEPPLKGLTMIIGCPRPPTARRLVKDLVTLGVGRLLFTDTDLNEKSYLQAKFWRDGLNEGAAREGAMQGKSTRIPPMDRYFSLNRALESLPGGETRLVPDLTDGPTLLQVLGSSLPEGATVAAAVGPERGWTDREREMLASRGFLPVSLGPRVLRTESAAVMTAGAILMALS